MATTLKNEMSVGTETILHIQGHKTMIVSSMLMVVEKLAPSTVMMMVSIQYLKEKQHIKQ